MLRLLFAMSYLSLNPAVGSVVVLADGGSPLEQQGQPPPEVMEPPTESTTQPPDPSTDAKPEEPLSEKLDKGKGVLEPPHGIDPEIKKQAPEDFQSTMPVLPPPGEPGGNQQIQPK